MFTHMTHLYQSKLLITCFNYLKTPLNLNPKKLEQLNYQPLSYLNLADVRSFQTKITDFCFNRLLGFTLLMLKVFKLVCFNVRFWGNDQNIPFQFSPNLRVIHVIDIISWWVVDDVYPTGCVFGEEAWALNG